MKTLAQHHKENPVVAEGVRALNDLTPRSSITYLTYRSWVVEKKKPSAAYRLLLAAKGVRA
jgi:hypothetical protein